MRTLNPETDQNIIAGVGEDALAYSYKNSLLVQSVDFITPVVDDPYIFGLIAAANSLSDIYAKGATPLIALNIVCFPTNTLPLHYLEDILKGGQDKCKEAGVIIGGGHTIDDYCPKYGLSVTGKAELNHFYSKSMAKPGDHIYLTKPLGFGIYTAAIDRKYISEQQTEEFITHAVQLNKYASEAMKQGTIHASTDVTGYGLIGHLLEIAINSNVSMNIDCRYIPYLSDTFFLAEKGAASEGLRNNLLAYRHQVEHLSPLSVIEEWLLHDPQTSGGLLFTVPETEALELEYRFIKNNLPLYKIGAVTEKRELPIYVQYRFL
ncbi:selenide, water dikinase SelD [Desulfuribacillus stibiiarsenatis]|uniref:Selenide, water dikinase SelD n=1 Tax=Desulfuribacillus stibiiarsenatis TaxID=1390249 RepID=A0A1E5L4M1_9FIRM|nr:selenide, water dikinase SelD [Desulfuribacillus stibiiarsenatis]